MGDSILSIFVHSYSYIVRVLTTPKGRRTAVPPLGSPPTPYSAEHSNSLSFKHKRHEVYSCQKSSLHTAVYAIHGFDKHRTDLNSTSIAEMGFSQNFPAHFYSQPSNNTAIQLLTLNKYRTNNETASSNAGVQTNIHVLPSWMMAKAMPHMGYVQDERYSAVPQMARSVVRSLPLRRKYWFEWRITVDAVAPRDYKGRRKEWRQSPFFSYGCCRHRDNIMMIFQ